MKKGALWFLINKVRGDIVNILIIGDICGRPGRQTARQYIPRLKEEFAIDLVVANGENAAAGVGITQKVLKELYDMGIDIVTSGNHIWDKKEIFEFIDDEPYLVRPANYPPGTPGKGYCIYPWRDKKIGVINLAGRSFMPALDCPFQKVDAILTAIREACDVILLDFHAETTSEKMAMGWYLDGKITCMVGTHTHVQTADERILPGGSAYITDLGMVGPWDSVLGVQKELVLKKFKTGLPVRFVLAEKPTVFSAVVVEADENKPYKTRSIKRIMMRDLELSEL